MRRGQPDTGQIMVVRDPDDDSRGFVGDSVHGRVFSENGRALTGRFGVGGKVPDCFDRGASETAALPGGGFVVTLTLEHIDRDAGGVAARTFERGMARDEALRMYATGTLAGLGGDDELRGGGGADLLLGGAGRDALLGGGRAGAAPIRSAAAAGPARGRRVRHLRLRPGRRR